MSILPNPFCYFGGCKKLKVIYTQKRLIIGPFWHLMIVFVFRYFKVCS